MSRFILSLRISTLLFCFCIIALQGYAQQTVKGRVVSLLDKQPLPGVNVIVKGTTTGVVTDFDGKYSLEVPGQDAVLVFSFIGFESEEVPVASRSEINISLSPSVEELNEVIVVGYSAKTKQEITGSVVNLSAEEIKGVTVPNLETMLQGKVAGVQVTSATGAPGAAAEIRIRGNSSINADRGPLVVVDGIIGGSYNPNDVESVTVLKDAGAIALYGSRANAGVIVVTTKKGSTEKTEITVRSTVGTRQITTGNFGLMNAQQLYDTERLMFNSSAVFNGIRPATVLETDTDWLDLAYKTGIVQNHNISATGSSGKVRYYLAGDYYDEEGTLLSTNYQRLNFRSNLDFELSDAVRLTTNFNITRDKNNSYHWRWPYQPFLYLPYDTPYDEEGNIRYVDANTPGFLTRDKNNILHSAQYNDYATRGLTMNGDVVLSVDVTPWFSLQTRNRISYSNYRNDTYEDVRTIEGRSNSGILSFGVTEGVSGITTNLARFYKDFGPHHLNGFIGFEAQQWTSESAGANGYGVVSGIKIPGGVASPQGISGTKVQTSAQSFLSEVSYDYREKYFVSASFRRDGSSVFGANKRWGNFGALSASWLISNENFFSSLGKTVSLLKLRGSYGIVGNDNIPAFQYLALYNFATQYNGGSAGYPETLPNPDLGWEQTKAADLGLDITLFNRLDITVDGFYKDTDRLLSKVQLPPSQGIAEVWRNAGRVVNQGFELGIGGDVVHTQNVSWNVNFNIGTAQNQVKELPEGTIINKVYDGVKQSVRVGEDINSWYLPKWVGVDPENGDPQWEQAVTDSEGNVVEYQVTNQYALASATSSLQLVGTATPDFFGGLNSSLSFKGLTLSVSSAFQYGNLVYHRTREFVDADGANFNFNMMQLADGWSRWQNPGDVATHPKPVFGGNLQSNRPSSRYLEDGSFWRIRNIMLNYNLPGALLSKVKIARANIFISGDNLFTFTKFSGMDPEVGSFGLAGLSDFKYPISKQYLVGLQISF
ncbi:TonB-dependent receptor [Cesiribacter sp. SM1]|uniref:SusC/RagA family TonB-linked outer membrane protein n=1 Tax=Cesiribacter sp. SM1 TaxID=2861196 RepID=UPI001CD2F88A|nr:TonB-dependent receptor [Cesiribacter sp. SM1]